MHVGGRVNVVVSGNTRTEQIRTQGEPNRNGNDGTIARFGWKAQNKSLLLFAAVAAGFVINTFIATPGPALAGTVLIGAGVPVYFFWAKSAR
jgi:uncharacterized membrane protein AbrB (regulator of aidB expression)